MNIKCDKDCFNCVYDECLYHLADKQEERNKILDACDKAKEKIRHAKYYENHREEILVKQKQRDKERDRVTYSKSHYLAHKTELNKKSRERYQKNIKTRRTDARRYYEVHKEEINKRRKELRDLRRNLMITNEERIRALVGNLKNHPWDIYPQYKLEKEDAEALKDIDALKRFIAHKEQERR